MDRISDEFFCPKCGRPAEICVAERIWSMKRLNLPYFVCPNCSLIYYDKPLVRKRVSEWRNNEKAWGFTKEIPFRIAYREAKKMMEAIVQYKIKEMDYKFVRFKKKKK